MSNFSRRRAGYEGPGDSASYAERQAMSPMDRLAYKRAGGRFRSRPGAPMATPPQGLTTGKLSVPDPEATSARQEWWGKTFKNTIYGAPPPTVTNQPMTSAAETGAGRFKSIAATDNTPDSIIAEEEDWHRKNSIPLPQLATPTAEERNAQWGKIFGKNSVYGGRPAAPVPLPQRLARLNSDGDYPELPL